jgi:hypothetical protein
MTLTARWRPLLPFAAIVLVAALLTLPAAIGPVRLNDSFWIDWVWLDQFADQLRQGILYPRWLPLSHGGLGSPVFYYYPPLAFYLASIFVLGGLGTYAGLIAAFFAAYTLSGAAMYAWLRHQAQRPLLGALLYLAAPYHAFNFYIRGAIAESLGSAILPLVMLGLWRVAEDKRGGFALTALSYGMLIAAHLPLALLASLFLFGPYALWLARPRWKALAPVAAALATGIGLSAIYLVPALALEPFRDNARLWHNPALQPHNWTLWNPQFWRDHSYAGVLVIAAAIAIPLMVGIARRSGWAAWGLGCTLLAVGAVPILWSAPLLSAVQFPFRLLPVAEFALAAAVAFAPVRPLLLAMASLPLVAVTGQIIASTPGSESVTTAQIRAFHPDVPENLPPGDRPYSWPSRWALGIAQTHREPVATGGVTVEPVFYFTAWRVTCGSQAVETFADPATRLLSYKGEGCAPKLGLTAPEKIGGAISLLAFLALLARSAIGYRRRRRRS